MDPVTVALTLAAFAKAFPSLVDTIKSFAEMLAADKSLNLDDLIKAIDGDNHEQVDAQVDRVIESVTWPKP